MRPSSSLKLKKLRAIVFISLNPNETLLEIDNNPNIQFTIKDFPGNQEFKENNANDIATIKQCGSLIYVIDAQQ